MEIITKKDLIEFIMAQPDERPIKMNESTDLHECGCVMVHYGVDVLKRKGFSCGSVNFFLGEDGELASLSRAPTCGLECRLDVMIPIKFNESLTYGELKKRLTPDADCSDFQYYLEANNIPNYLSLNKKEKT